MPGLPGLVDTDVAGFIAKVRRETSWTVWLALVAGAALFVVTPILTVHRPLPSPLLSARLRDAHADRILTSDFYLLRQTVYLLKMYACMCWGQDPAVRKQFHVAPYPADPGTFRTG